MDLDEENAPRFRPPAEADSLILQMDVGCPHKSCQFCGMYKDEPYRSRDERFLAHVIENLSHESRLASRVFLADGDVMSRSFSDLETMLKMLNASLPRLQRVSLYANGSSILSKTDEELRALRSLKLHTLYMGLESGDAAVLSASGKQETVEGMVRAGLRAQQSGLRMSVMVLLGLGGVKLTYDHAVNSAGALNQMQPRLLSVLRVIPLQGTPLFQAALKGRFRALSDYDIVLEMRMMIEHLDLKKSIFRANHGSNVVPLEGRFPQDRDRLLRQIDELLESGLLDKHPPRLPFGMTSL